MVLIFILHCSLPLYIYIYIGLGVRVFANGPGDLGSIPGRVIPKTQKMVLDASLLNTQHYKVRIKGKVEQSREGVAPSPTHWCSSYRKGSLPVTLDYGRQLYLYICSSHRSISFCESMPLLRESVTHWPINWQSALIPSPSQELFFLVPFCRTDKVREPGASRRNTSLSHDCHWFHLEPFARC